MANAKSLLNVIDQASTAAAALAEAQQNYPDATIGTDNGYGIPITRISNFLPVGGIIDTTGRVGTSGDDLLLGSKYANTMLASDGNDVLKGLGGNDVMKGGNGNDTLIGGAGNDSLNGGTGDDTFVFGMDSGKDRVTGFTAGHDKINVSAWGFDSAADALSHVTTNAKGDFVLQLSETDSVVFHNASGPLTDVDFII